jgi:hypothetical protein
MRAFDRIAFALQKLRQQGAEFGVIVDQQKSHGSECSMENGCGETTEVLLWDQPSHPL